MRTPFTVLPFLVSFLIALSGLTPTNVVAVNRDGMGHEHEQPWRSKALSGALTRIAETTDRVAQALADLWGHPLRGPALTGAAVLVTWIVAPDALDGVAALPILSVRLFEARQNELLAEIAKAKKDRAAIGEAVIARPADQRQMTDEERARFLAFGPAIEKLDASLAENELLLKAAREQAEAERNFRVERPDPDVEAARLAAEKAGIAKPKIEVVDMTKTKGYFGRQLQAVYRFGSERGQMENLQASDRDLLKPMMAAATGMNTDVGSDGGFLVSQDRSSNIIQRAYATGEILKRVTPIPISANANGLVLPAIDETSRADGSRYGGIVSGWLGQGNTLTSGKPKFRPMDLKLRKVGAFVYATDELLADAGALEAWVNKHLPMELRFRTEDAFVNGTGANQPLGILNSGAVLSLTRSQTGRILSDDLRAMVRRLWAPLWPTAVFLVDQSTLSEFDLLAIPIGTGGTLDPSYRPAGDGRAFGSYKNIPIIPVEYMAALGTTGDIVLSSWDEYVAIDKGGIEQAVSLHVAFLTDEQVFRFMYRVDGQHSWNSVLTPKSGGETLAPCVKLTT